MERSVLIAIPAFNEEARIGEVINGVMLFGDTCVFNNNSSDNTKAISLKQGAFVVDVLEEGYESVVFEIVKFFEDSIYTKLVIIDGDGEVGIDSIAKAISLLDTYEIVLGNRRYKKRFGERLICNIFKYFYGINDIYCGFKCFLKSGLNKERVRGTFATSIVNKKSNYINLDVDVYLREDKSKLGEGISINLKLISSGIKGFLN